MSQDLLIAAPGQRPAQRASDDIIVIPDPPTQPSHIRLDIQGLRAVAVLAVIAYHANRQILPGGFVGVDVFFVISGYVIAGVLKRTTETSRKPLREFYGRRIRRLMPPAAVMAAVTLTATLFIVPFNLHQPTARWAQAAALSASNIWFTLLGHSYFASTDTSNPFLHTWSLGVEEQFYLAIPVMYVGLRRLGRRWSLPALTTGTLAAIGVVSLALSVHLTRGGVITVGPWRLHNADVAFYSPVTRAWEFLAGFAASSVVLAGWRRTVAAARGVAVVTLAGCLALLTDTAPFPGWRAMVPVAATVALLVTGRGVPARVLSSAPLARIGDISYGLYLWHWPALVFSRYAFNGSSWAVPVALAATAPLALLSYRLLEVKARAAKPFSAWRTTGTLAICVAAPMALALALIAVSPILSKARGVSVPLQLGFGGAVDAACSEVDVHRPWDRAQCAWGYSRRVFLIGDSHAMAIGPMVEAAAEDSGLGFATWAHLGCPVSTAVAVDSPGCADWQADVVTTVLGERPALVVIANRSTAYSRAPGETMDVHLPGQSVPRSEGEALDVWDQGLRPVIAQFSRAGIPVLLFSNSPEFPDSPVERMSFLYPNRQITDPIPVADVHARNDRVHAVEQGIVSATPGAALFDPVPYLCDQLCRQYDGTRWLYFDDDHLSPEGAGLLQGPFEAAVRAALRNQPS